MKTYKMIEDPGHAWLEVPINELATIKDKITPYSYLSFDGRKAYLEEDCDAPKFINLIGGIDKIEIKNVIYDSDCFVRRLPGFEI